MSEPSNWPLSQTAMRVVVPDHLLQELRVHSLTRACYTTAIGYYPEAKSHEMKRADHDDFILIYCAEGKGIVRLGAECQTIKAGDLFILPPNTAHAYYADDILPWTVYWCHFQGETAQDFYDYIYQKQTNTIIKNMTDVDVVQSFRNLVETVRNSRQLSSFIQASNLFRHILTRLERQAKERDKTDNSLSISRIQYFMRANINKQLTLDELAGLSHCSKFHFVRQYKHITGISPLKHFIELKIEHACFLLEQTSLNMSEIAAHLGYDDALYFSRVFRRVQGQAPSAYRRGFVNKF